VSGGSGTRRDKDFRACGATGIEALFFIFALLFFRRGRQKNK
jgi:hypothetical protein